MKGISLAQYIQVALFVDKGKLKKAKKKLKKYVKKNEK
jgi:hypothetical protein